MTIWAHQISAITETRSHGLDPLHEPNNTAKVAELAASMKTNGWQGAPIVAAGEQALTGSHRIAAVSHLWNRDGIDVEIPRVEIADLCELYGLHWTTILMDEHDGDTYQAASALRELLPREVVGYLGYDVDGAL